MPLLRQAPFVKRRVPRNLKNSHKLFHLELTDEVFTDYEEYSYRIIQVNSLVWTCEETGRTELTFSEALESERIAKETVASFPYSLKVPALYLASMAETTSFQEMVSHVFTFMKNHYFLGEIVVPCTRENWKKGKIVGVEDPTAQNVKSGKSISSNKCQKYTPPGLFLYKVDSNLDEMTSEIHQINGAKIKRANDFLFTEDSLSAFIKCNAVLDSRGIWIIKGSSLREFNIELMKFTDIFIGEPSVFTGITDKKIVLQSKQENSQIAGISDENTSKGMKNAIKKSGGMFITSPEGKHLSKALPSNSEQSEQLDSPSRKGSKHILKSSRPSHKHGAESVTSSKKVKEQPAMSGKKQKDQSVVPGGKQKEESVTNRKRRSHSVTPDKKVRKLSATKFDRKNENSKKGIKSLTSKRGQKEPCVTPKKVTMNQLSSNNKSVRQTGQQNIEQYMILSKKSIESKNDAVDKDENKTCSLEIGSGEKSNLELDILNENKINDTKSKNTTTVDSKQIDSKTKKKEYDSKCESSTYTLGSSRNLDSDPKNFYSLGSSRNMDSEAGSSCTLRSSRNFHLDADSTYTVESGWSDVPKYKCMYSLDNKKSFSDAGSSLDISESEVSKFEGETSSDEELNVLWSSNVMPSRQVIEEILEQQNSENHEETNSVSENESDKDKSFMSCSSVGSEKLYIEENAEERVEISPKSLISLDTEPNQTRSREDYESIKRGTKKPNFSNKEQEPSEKQPEAKKKKLKQTHMFDGIYDNKNADQMENSLVKKRNKSCPPSHKKVFKKGSSHVRKQRIVGTLKPWVHATKKEGYSLPKQTQEAAPDHSEPNSKEVKRNWLEAQRQIELEEKLKRQEERRLLKAKQEEEKLKFANFMKEWKKPREDLLCEDLKPLPPTCDVSCRITNELFGDFMVILEFFHTFGTVLKMKSSFPMGLTFEYLERALVETEIAGPLNGIICVLLKGIFIMQMMEHEKPKSDVPITGTLSELKTGLDLEEVIPTGWSSVFQGVPLHDIPINHGTISEILRLHLLGSGGRAWDSTSKWSSLRGGNTDLEDPGLWLRFEKPFILKKLSQLHVCELSVDEKLEVLTCLANQFLTYAHVRDKLDALSHETQKVKASVRSLQIAELKLEKEAASRRYKARREAKLSKLSLEEGTLTPIEKVELENQKLEKEMVKLKADIQKKASKILPMTMNHQLLPIGCDRAHRRYWMFSSLPGLFVERNIFEVGQCLPQPTPQVSELADTLTHVRRLFEEESHYASNDKENYTCGKEISKPTVLSPKKMLAEQNKSVGMFTEEKENAKTDEMLGNECRSERELLICSSCSNCPVHSPSDLKAHWSFFPYEEHVSILLECLNERGIRESALRHVILQEQDRIIDSINQCPLHKLNPEKFTEADQKQRKSTRIISGYTQESAQMNYPPSTSIKYIMEWTLREFILHLESKITSGNVGSLKVYDRMAWRRAIEEGRYEQQCDSLQCGFEWCFSLQKDAVLSNIDQRKEIDQFQDPQRCDNEVNVELGIKYGEIKDGQEKDEVPEEIESKKTAQGKEGNVPVEKIVEDVVNDMFECREKNHKTSSQKEEQQLKEQERNSDEEMGHTSPEGMSGESTAPDMNQANEEPGYELHEEFTLGEINEQKRISDDEMLGESAFGDTKQQSNDSSQKRGLTKAVNEDRSSDEEDTTEYGSGNETNREDELDCLSESQYQNTEGNDVDSECDDGDHYGNSGKELRINLHESLKHETTDVGTDETGIGTSSRNPIVKELACAILQLGQSLDPEFLKKQLASDDRSRKRVMKFWEVSLMKTINFSQLFIHLSVLESSINWSKSSLHTQCSICRRRGNAEKMLLCDGCNRGHHMFCLKPKLKAVPKGDWFCPKCTHNERRSTRIREKKNMVQDNDSLSDVSSTRSTRVRNSKSYSEKGNSNVILVDEHIKSCEEDDERLCQKCSQAGTLMFCSTCSVGFHSECVNLPSQSHVQNKSWQCESCKLEMLSSKFDGGEIYSPSGELKVMYKNRRERTAETQPRKRRGCATATLARIATFTKRLRTSSWDDDGEASPQENPAETTSDDFDFEDYLVRRSSRRSLIASDDLPLDNAVLQNLLAEMLQHEDAWPFRKAVRKSEVPDYHSIIKKPMDLGTVKYKLNTAEYSNNAEFVADVLLVFKNCFMYNRCHTIEYKCATRLLKFFEKRSHELSLAWTN